MSLRYADSRHKAELLATYLEDTHGLTYQEAYRHAEILMSEVEPWIAFRENGWRLVNADRVKVRGGKP